VNRWDADLDLVNDDRYRDPVAALGPPRLAAIVRSVGHYRMVAIAPSTFRSDVFPAG
jgi:hypothetical protein